MSELKDRWFWAYPTESVDCDGITGSAHEVYSKSEVDEVIAEKDKEIAELKQKLEDAKATAYTESVDAGMENRKLKRALWLARADRAKDRATTCNDFAYLGDTEREINMSLARTWMKCRMLKPSEWSKVWNNVERKCRAKAEAYK